jgi:hypothetical protein
MKFITIIPIPKPAIAFEIVKQLSSTSTSSYGKDELLKPPGQKHIFLISHISMLCQVRKRLTKHVSFYFQKRFSFFFSINVPKRILYIVAQRCRDQTWYSRMNAVVLSKPKF